MMMLTISTGLHYFVLQNVERAKGHKLITAFGNINSTGIFSGSEWAKSIKLKCWQGSFSIHVNDSIQVLCSQTLKEIYLLNKIVWNPHIPQGYIITVHHFWYIAAWYLKRIHLYYVNILLINIEFIIQASLHNHVNKHQDEK